MAICCNFRNSRDEEIVRAWLRTPPCVGDILWFNPDIGTQKVISVCHWISSVWTPNTHATKPIHSLCIYVEALPGKNQRF
jgi:hypothetical protein